MFSSGSRYQAGAAYQVILPSGASVYATSLPLPPAQPVPLLGYQPSAGAERLDLLAFRYLNDATAFWRICDANNAMVPWALAARALIAIPDAGA